MYLVNKILQMIKYHQIYVDYSSKKIILKKNDQNNTYLNRRILKFCQSKKYANKNMWNYI